MTAWKDFERRVARALGGERSGQLGKHGSDATGVPYAVECKRTTRYSLRRAWVEQARRQSRDEGRPWLLVISEHGDRAPIVVCDFKFLAGVLAGDALRSACSQVSADVAIDFAQDVRGHTQEGQT